MRLNRVHAGLASGAALLLATGSAFAQDAAPVEATAAPAEEPAAEPEPEPAPAAEEETPAVETKAEVANEAQEEEQAAAGPTGLSFMLFGDAYATMQTSQPGDAVPGHRAYVGSSPARTVENGFSLNMIGLDVGYAAESWGVTTSLRFGPSVNDFYAADPVLGGIGSITQAYVTWIPVEPLTIDFGMFGTIYGAEVAESWVNLNYTRGALYYLMQPFWHTGARVGYQLGENFKLMGLLVNDANQVSLDPASDLQAGLQLQATFGDLFLALGTLQTLGDDNGFIDRFFDVVATYGAGDFSLVFNADLNIDDSGDAASFWGASLGLGYAFAPAFGAAIRGEILDPSLGVDDDMFLTGTLTFDFKPVPGVENVVLRWDNRIEAGMGANASYWTDGGGAATDFWYSSTIGLAMHTGGLF